MKLERMGSMVTGMPCPINIDGRIKYYKVQSDKQHITPYVKILGKKFTETTLPMDSVIEL